MSSKQPILWTNPRNPKERVTIYRAPAHEDGRPRVICDLCSFPCVVSGTGTSTRHLSNFTIHRGSANCLKRSATTTKGSAAVRSGGGGKGKITSHFARTPSTSSRASSAAVSEILDEGETDGGSVPGTVSSSSPQGRPMEIDLTSPEPEPEPVVVTAKGKGKEKAGAAVKAKKDEIKIIQYDATTKGKAQARTSLSGATSDELEVVPPKPKKAKATTYGATTTSYETAASTSSASTRTTPLTTLVIPNAPNPNPTTTPTSTSTLPTCTTCRHPNTTPQYKMCEPCRIYYRDRSRIKAERVKASAALKLAEAGGDVKEIERAREESERMRGLGAKRDYGGVHTGGVGGAAAGVEKAGKKRKRDVEPVVQEERMPEIVFDPDECGTAAQAYSILLSELNPPPVNPPRTPLPPPKLNIRLTWAVVADGSISHRSRIEGVVRELRGIGLQFGSVGKTQEPGSRYARYNTITEKYRCKCTVSTPSKTTTPSNTPSAPKPAKALARKQSDLSSFFPKPKPKGKGAIRMEEEEEDVLMLVPPELVNNGGGGGGAGEEKCGGNVYVSSEWDLKSHPCGVRGQRVVVWVVHESDPIQ